MGSLSPTVDLREHPVEELERELLKRLGDQPPALLWVARRPKKNWFRELTSYRPLVLTSSARYEQILWLSPAVDPAVPEDWVLECHQILEGYRELFQGRDLDGYSELVQSHINSQENDLFPRLLGFLPSAERALKELTYEHRGMEAGLTRLPGLLRQWDRGELDARAREHFDLEFFHLVEHNLERKLEAVYPALAYFERG
ncbi:MAG: hypothetical protein WC314_02835 [Vulcanimicrobiota bacterium]